MKHDASVFLESSDPHYFSSYVELRRREFHRCYPGLPSGFGFPDQFDRCSRIVYALRQGEVAGGARLTVSRPGHPIALPLEDQGFHLAESEVAGVLDIEHRPYAEISRMAVDSNSTDGLQLSRGMCRLLCRIAVREGAAVIFSICPDYAARLNRINAKALGVRFSTFGKLATGYGRDMWLCVFTGLEEVTA